MPYPKQAIRSNHRQTTPHQIVECTQALIIDSVDGQQNALSRQTDSVRRCHSEESVDHPSRRRQLLKLLLNLLIKPPSRRRLNHGNDELTISDATKGILALLRRQLYEISKKTLILERPQDRRDVCI